MLDTLITGGTLVDGTGAPARPADIGIAGDRIVAVADPGELADAAASPGAGTTGTAAETIDADGLIVCPGFIDPHTHYDAQIFWDPRATPSNLFGVTSVIGGNCGFTLAPLTHPDDGEYLKRMMVKVEGMELAALEQGVPWDWESFADYLRAVETRGIGVNAGFLVGHCALRRCRNAGRRRRPRGQRRPDRPDAGPAGRVAGRRRPRLLHRPQLHPQRLGRPARPQPLGLRPKRCWSCAGRPPPTPAPPWSGWPTAA